MIGGWLTDNLNWRWIFYINLPLGALAFAGIWLFMYETRSRTVPKFDWLGFGSLSVASSPRCRSFSIAAASSTGSPRFEIILEATVAVSALYIFLVHIFTAQQSVCEPAAVPRP